MRGLLGVVLAGERTLYWKLTARENLLLFGGLYNIPRKVARKRADELLELVGLSEFANVTVEKFSTGMRKRLAIAKALIHQPPVLILDEPTAGLDPVGQAEVFGVIERLCRERRMTIVMVSQDAERIARFADRLAIMWQGRIVRVDAPPRIFTDQAFLEEVGLAAPQVSELAVALNRRWGTGYRFTLLEEAEEALRRDLCGGQASS